MAAKASVGFAEIWEALRFGAGPAAFIVLYGLFAKLEDIASPDAKRDIAAWLKRAEVPGSLVNWPSQFAALFDRVFGERHLSWRCFFRSSIASLAAVAVMTVIWAALRPMDALNAYFTMIMRDWAVIIAMTLVAFNLLPDYASLLESRFAIKVIKKYGSRAVTLFALLVDAVVSPLLFVLIGAGVVSLLLVVADIHSYVRDLPPLPLPREYFYYISSLVEEVLEYGLTLSSRPGQPSIGIFLYATLFTSVWVWLYGLAAGVVRLALSLQPVLRALKWFLDIDGKPIRSIGVVVGLIGAVFWWGLVFIAGPEGEPAASTASLTLPTFTRIEHHQKLPDVIGTAADAR